MRHHLLLAKDCTADSLANIFIINGKLEKRLFQNIKYLPSDISFKSGCLYYCKPLYIFFFYDAKYLKIKL